MAQRHQTLIKYINKEWNNDKEVRICTLHSTWCYGRRPIENLFKIAHFNKMNTIEGNNNSHSLTDDSYCYIDKIDTIIKLISVDYKTGYIGDFNILDKEREFRPIGELCNNDGYLLIDLTKGNKIHYAFVSGFSSDYKVLDGAEYFALYKKDYDSLDSKDEINEVVNTSLEFINENCILMLNEDIEIFK